MRPNRISVVLSLVLLSVSLAFPVPLRVLATGDMHGWLQGSTVGAQALGGAAEMLAYWQREEAYTPEGFLLLSCGDIATGPALATAFKGDPVVEVMNRMGYDASVLGNHEFDFGHEDLERWKKSAAFPFLAANLVQENGTSTPLATPSVMLEEQGLKIGVIGLITKDVAAIASTGGLVGQDYAPVLNRLVPEVRARGAQVVIVVAHVGQAELVKLAKQVSNLRIPLILGGHSHELAQQKVPGAETWIINTGEWWRSYSRIDLDYDPHTGNTVVLGAKQVWLQQRAPAVEPQTAAIIADWQQRLDEEYRRPIGFTATGIKRPWGVYNFLTDCWLEMNPQADIALSNNGGFRQDIPAGPINKGAIVGVMPFSNSLFRVTVTGAQLLAYLPKDNVYGMAGIRVRGNTVILAKTGKPLDPKAAYRVLVNSYMYASSAALQTADPKPLTVAEDWRDPVYAWFTKHPSNQEKPLESFIDQQPRKHADK